MKKIENYRPIHLTFISRTCEYTKLYFGEQIGKKTQISSIWHCTEELTGYSVLAYIEEVLAAVDSGNFATAAYFNFVEAFDSVPQSRLIKTLSKQGRDQDFSHFLYSILLTELKMCV